ncbi:MAG: hypothetical protein IJF32_12985 [Oscillospiraceae bacterium]|nr:hypothetical protein [Oscillospiraceae bacterium]
MNSKATKAALVTSLTSLVLCFTMLMGTTLAWFVDRVESTNNRIEAGNLEVDLVMLKGGEYVSIAGGNGDLFAEAEGLVENVLWQPNVTKKIYLGVRNKGSLALAYTAVLNVSGDETLRKNLEYAIVPLDSAEERINKTWDEIKMLTSQNGNLLGVEYNEENGQYYIPMGAGILKPAEQETENADKDGETRYYAFVVKMANNPDGECMGKSATIDVSVHATQLTPEQRKEREAELFVLSKEELPETISATAWKLKTEVADFSFLEKTEDEDESEEIIFPEETEISDGDNTYPLSELRVISLEDAKLLAAVPVVNEENKTDEAGTEAETEAPTEKVFVYYQKTVETTETDETVKDISGWYLLELESVQTALSDKNADLTNLFEGKEPITEAEKLPVITFPDAEDGVLKNTDIINWLYNSAELLPAAEDNN